MEQQEPVYVHSLQLSGRETDEPGMGPARLPFHSCCLLLCWVGVLVKVIRLAVQAELLHYATYIQLDLQSSEDTALDVSRLPTRRVNKCNT